MSHSRADGSYDNDWDIIGDPFVRCYFQNLGSPLDAMIGCGLKVISISLSYPFGEVRTLSVVHY